MDMPSCDVDATASAGDWDGEWREGDWDGAWWEEDHETSGTAAEVAGEGAG